MAASNATSSSMSRGSYGQQWGEGAARCFSIESDLLDEDESVRLTPIPECFICPMSQTPMEDPVMTVDGCVYERQYIEHWIRHRQQQGLSVTSPLTNRELPSHRLVSLTALKKAIETYLAHRPELRGSLASSRSFEEAAQLLQSDLIEKQAAHVRVEDELSLLRDSNEALLGALDEAERSHASATRELTQARQALRESEEARAALLARARELEEKCSSERAAPAQACGRCAPGSGWPWSVAARCVFCLLLGAASATLAGQLMAPARGEMPASSLGTAKVWLAAWREAEPAAAAAHLEAGALGLGSSDGLLGDEGGANSTAGVPYWPAGGAASYVEVVQGEREASAGHGGPTGARLRVEGDSEEACKACGDDDPRITRQVALLRRGTQEDKTRAALVLGLLASTGPEAQAAIVRAGAVAQLVDLLRGESPEARGQAAVALRAVAANSTYNKVAIVRAGAIPPLIQILRADAPEIQEVAAGALEILAETNGQAEIAQAGAIIPLVALLNDERPKAREEAAGALGLLAQSADNRAAIAQVGAIPLLVELLRDQAPEVRVQAAAALRSLAAEEEADAGAPPRAAPPEDVPTAR